MDTTTIDPRDEDYDDFDERDGPTEAQLPIRPRRRFLNGITAFLIAAITAAGGFYAGVRVEKHQVSGTSGGFGGLGGAGGSGASSRLRSLLAARFGAAAGGAGAAGATGGAGALPSGAAAGGAAAGGLPGGFAARFGAGGFGGGGTSGTVSSVDGNTIYLQENSGNTVKVTLNGTTTVTKSESVSRKKINPGDTVSVQGLTKSSGAIAATSVSDSGSGSSSGASAGGSGGSGTSGTSGGGLSSLFSSGG